MAQAGLRGFRHGETLLRRQLGLLARPDAVQACELAQLGGLLGSRRDKQRQPSFIVPSCVTVQISASRRFVRALLVCRALPIGCSGWCEPQNRGVMICRIVDWCISHIIRCWPRSPSVCAMAARSFFLFSRHLT